MTVIFISLFSFCAWLIWLTYFRASYEVSAIGAEYSSEMEAIAYKKRSTSEHFHNIDDFVIAGAESTSVCLQCHGNYPHSKAADIRSFLNAHTFFLACETCHIKKREGETMMHVWLDNQTGEELLRLEGKAGNYGAKIVPLIKEGGQFRRLDISTDEKFIKEYLKLRATFNADQNAEAKIRIHKDISKKPVFCDECHRKQGYINFKELLYPPVVVRRLERGEAAGMIKKYKKFYLPTMFDPDMVRK